MRVIRNVVLLASALLYAGQLMPAQTTVQAVGIPEQTKAVEFGIFLPLQNRDQLDRTLTQMHSEGSQRFRRWMSPAEFQRQFGPKASDVAAIRDELATYNIQVVSSHAHGLRVKGTVADIQRVFQTQLATGITPAGQQRLIATTPLTLPASLQTAQAMVLAFSSKVRMHSHAVLGDVMPDNRRSAVGPYWFGDLKQAYNFPSVQLFSGVGQTIGILMSNDFSDQDMADYFGHEGLPVPTIVRVPVDGGAPFGFPESLETSLDIQQAGGMAPGATIMHYNIPDLSDVSIFDGLIQILSDNAVDVVNMSFGGAEAFYTADYNGGVDFTSQLRLFDDIFKQGNAQGITFVASSGDSGALGRPPLSYLTSAPQNPAVTVGDWQVGVEFPAVCPHVTAVGGTNLVTTSVAGSLNSAYVSENADSDPQAPNDPYGTGNLVANGVWGSGGGISQVFAKPSYQRLVNTGSNMRTIPDLSMHMGGCPRGSLSCDGDRSADYVRLAGGYYAVIGTSASSPDFAGVLAVTEESLGGYRLGNANNHIYALAAAQNFGIVNVFHQGIPGFNGFYYSQAGVPGYNLVLGNGTVSVRDFMLTPTVPPAGPPQTPSNP